MNTSLIAKAIVYAARQAFMINNYGMTWEDIEVNTANILAADGKMNSAEAVANRINDTMSWSEANAYHDAKMVEHLNGIISRQINSLRRIKGERDEAQRDLIKTKEAMRIEATAAQAAREHNAELLRLLGATRAELLLEQDAKDTWRKTAANTAQERDIAVTTEISGLIYFLK